MKNTIKIIAGAALLASFAACSQKIDFVSSDYARFDSLTYTFNEDAGTVTIPVYANAGANGTVNFEVIENTAKAGVDFSIAGNSVTVSNGSCAGIVINIVNQEGVFTSDLNFTIRLTGTSEGLGIGGIYETRVTIKDLDHPLADLLGSYSSGPVFDYWGDGYDIVIEIEPVDGSVNEVTVSNLCPYSVEAGYTHKLHGYVNDDKTQIRIPDWQSIYGNALVFVALDDDMNEVDDFILNINADGTISTSQPFGAYVASGSGWYDLIFPDPVITWTKR